MVVLQLTLAAVTPIWPCGMPGWNAVGVLAQRGATGQRGARLRAWLWISTYLPMGTTAQGSRSLPMLLVTSLWITYSLGPSAAATSRTISVSYVEAVTVASTIGHRSRRRCTVRSSDLLLSQSVATK